MRSPDEIVAEYRKEIQISSTGMVIAHVYAYAADGYQLRCTGLAFFDGLFDSIERRAEKAHAWADKRIALCVKHEAQL